MGLQLELQELESLEENAPLSPEAYQTRVYIQMELHDIYAEEELLWVQRSS